METIKVLLVDDEPDLTKFLSRRLARRDLDVTSVSSGQEAVEKFGKERFDVVILDMKMPGMDGMATLKKIRALDPKARVIILTGHASADSASRGMDLGALDYMLKPVDMDDLLFRIKDAVRAPMSGN